MMKKQKGLGTIIYMEWLYPVKDYYCTLMKNEVIFEIVSPGILALICTIFYAKSGKMFDALNGLGRLLPSAISILIGFTVMLISILLTSSGESVDKLKNTYGDKKLYSKAVNLFQCLHIQFSHSLFAEIILLLLTFFYLFWNGIGMPLVIGGIFLWLEVFLTLNILLSILRGITNIYFSFYKSS